jgi:hypothetical protein
VNHQHFVQIPHARFIQLLEYKARLASIRFALEARKLHEPSLLSGRRPIPTYDPRQEGTHVCSGKRVKRGLYRAKDGRTLNADVNGSYTILRKAVASRLGQRDRGACSCARMVDACSVSPPQGVGGSVNRTNEAIAGYCRETINVYRILCR